MKPNFINQYDAPHQFEPLLPSALALSPLLEQASDLTRAATALGASTPTGVHADLRALLRSMNSYYTNRIEGEHTRPSDIERALQQDFSANADLARRQRLAVSHIQTEALCEAQLVQPLQQGHDVLRWLYDTPNVTWLHQRLFDGLPAVDLRLADGSLLQPGQLRTRGVAVGRHEAPAAHAVPAFLQRWSDVYGQARRGEAAVVAAAASHHRLAWVHPFLDGNGRVARLHTHLLFHAMGLSHGLWSPLRGFARSESRYKALLQGADEHRRGDLDGRGNLTQAGLVEWIAYVLQVCTDQAKFMSGLLGVQGMRERMAAALAFEAQTLKTGVRQEALIPLHYLFMSQAELGRADFKAMTGLGERVATQTVSHLVQHGFVATDSAYGNLRFAIPRRALRFYFPALWPEAEQDEAMEASAPIKPAGATKAPGLRK
jgi:Fic family protein